MAEVGVSVAYINDSKATNVDAVEKALRSLCGDWCVLIAGGRDKGLDFSSLKEVWLRTGSSWRC